ncbi:TetR/AcrR family transcriptional regulator [Georgenia halophila]|uniref:TetR/AcrR family transcriptional regulator n=1 Tax=Georgenia halophila TaxID=620889 RepID=A0ABP8KWS2_9MICO
MRARDRILDAAAEIMRAEGIARATTKEIARVAGCSEALLYKNFADKSQLFVAVLQERAPGLGEVLAGLPDRAGSATVRQNLTDVVRGGLDFYLATFPMAAGLFSDRALLDAHRARLAELGVGPEQVNTWVAEYLRREQSLGRVTPDADADSAASLLLGACLQRAFFARMSGQDAVDAGAEADRLVAVLCNGLVRV